MLEEKLKCLNEIRKLKDERDRLKADIKLREERIDELVRSFKDLLEAYEELVAERERMLKKSMKVWKVSYNDGLFIYRSKTMTRVDLADLGFEKGDELRLVIVKTPLAKIIKH